MAGLLVSACGSGGGVNSTPTPSPTPTSPTPTPTSPTPTPSQANASLVDLQYIERFANVAATANASFPTGGAAATVQSAPSTVTLNYDAATRGYTLAVDGRMQTFLPSQIDAAQSNAAITVYVRTNGDTTESLTLTKPGTSGRLTYQ